MPRYTIKGLDNLLKRLLEKIKKYYFTTRKYKYII